MENKEEKFLVSDALITLAKTWLIMALGAMVLYFIIKALEQKPEVQKHIYVGYHVPVERPPEVPIPDGKEL